MHSHKLIREKDPSKAEWLLEWDESVFTLKRPDGQIVFDTESAQAHWIIVLEELYLSRKVSLANPQGALTFKRQKAALEEVRRLVDAGLRSDLEYRQFVKEQSRKATRRGLRMFLGGGIPFALYCWWASWAPNPPPGLMQWIGAPIHLVLLFLLCLAIAGMSVTWFGVSQMVRIRRIDQTPSSNQ